MGADRSDGLAEGRQGRGGPPGLPPPGGGGPGGKGKGPPQTSQAKLLARIKNAEKMIGSSLGSLENEDDDTSKVITAMMTRKEPAPKVAAAAGGGAAGGGAGGGEASGGAPKTGMSAALDDRVKQTLGILYWTFKKAFEDSDGEDLETRSKNFLQSFFEKSRQEVARGGQENPLEEKKSAPRCIETIVALVKQAYRDAYVAQISIRKARAQAKEASTTTQPAPPEGPQSVQKRAQRHEQEVAKQSPDNDPKKAAEQERKVLAELDLTPEEEALVSEKDKHFKALVGINRLMRETTFDATMNAAIAETSNQKKHTPSANDLDSLAVVIYVIQTYKMEPALFCLQKLVDDVDHFGKINRLRQREVGGRLNNMRDLVRLLDWSTMVFLSGLANVDTPVVQEDPGKTKRKYIIDGAMKKENSVLPPVAVQNQETFLPLLYVFERLLPEQEKLGTWSFLQLLFRSMQKTLAPAGGGFPSAGVTAFDTAEGLCTTFDEYPDMTDYEDSLGAQLSRLETMLKDCVECRGIFRPESTSKKKDSVEAAPDEKKPGLLDDEMKAFVDEFAFRRFHTMATKVKPMIEGQNQKLRDDTASEIVRKLSKDEKERKTKAIDYVDKHLGDTPQALPQAGVAPDGQNVKSMGPDALMDDYVLWTHLKLFCAKVFAEVGDQKIKQYELAED